MNVQLRVLEGRPQGKCILFPTGEYFFGRGTECHIQPNSDWVSRQHCLLRVAAEGAWLRDLGSRNGTLVNGERVKGERPLEEGDQLQVGPLVFEVCFEEAEAVAAQPVPVSSSQTPTVPMINFQDTKEQPAATGESKAPAEQPATPVAKNR